MGSAKNFSALNTKISAMKNSLLTYEDFENLANMDNLNEIIGYLHDKELIEDRNLKYPNQVEVELTKNRIKILNKLKFYLDDEYNKLVELVLDKYIIDDIKKALRNISVGNRDIEKNSFIVMENFYDLIKEGITLEDFLESLIDTKFYKYIIGYKSQDSTNLLFFLEMSLDRNYFTNIFYQCDKLKKEDSKIVKKFYGEFIDLYNVSWIYRAKKFYKMPSVVIYNYSITGGELFNLNDIRNFSYKALNEFIDEILETKYNFIFDSEQDIDLYMERRIDRYLYYQSKDYIKENKYNFKKSLGLILITEYDLKDLKTILEARKYELNNEDIRKYLIRNIERKTQ